MFVHSTASSLIYRLLCFHILLCFLHFVVLFPSVYFPASFPFNFSSSYLQFKPAMERRFCEKNVGVEDRGKPEEEESKNDLNVYEKSRQKLLEKAQMYEALCNNEAIEAQLNSKDNNIIAGCCLDLEQLRSSKNQKSASSSAKAEVTSSTTSQPSCSGKTTNPLRTIKSSANSNRDPPALSSSNPLRNEGGLSCQHTGLSFPNKKPAQSSFSSSFNTNSVQSVPDSESIRHRESLSIGSPVQSIPASFVLPASAAPTEAPTVKDALRSRLDLLRERKRNKQ